MSDAQERTFKASDRHLKDVRRKGRLGRSQDLQAWVGLGAATLTLPAVVSRGRQAATAALAGLHDAAQHPDPGVAVRVLFDGLRGTLTAVLPILLVTVVVTVAVAAAQGGVHPRSFMPQPEQFNPLSGLKRLVGPQAWWQAVKVLAKSAAVGLVLFVTVKGLTPVLLASGRLSLSHVLSVAAGGTTSLLRSGIVVGVLLAAADLAVVLRRNRKQTRMTLREVKEEHKRSEGDPHVKAAIRARQQQMSRNRMMAAVAEADVVLVNPTHVAVALRYEPGKGAPRVVAKGAGVLAAKIRERASEHHVPLVEDIPLARALHAACEVGAEIPEYLFTAVARVLAFVMALRRRGAAAGQHRVPGGSVLPPGDTTDHRVAGKAAARSAARGARSAALGARSARPPVRTPEENR
ncbi:MAG TPA: EscU/YscU/HrcU family type III secretion system export apparatus switch protein [Cellulomonas sp.]